LTEPALEARGLAFSYPHGFSLGPLDLSVARGGFTALVGPNGSGKTTLLRLLDGALRPGRGSVRIGGRDLAGMTRREVARAVALFGQDTALGFPYRVGEIVLMGRHPLRGDFAFDAPGDLAAARDALERVGLGGAWDRFAFELSGGERQRVLLARVLTQGSPLLLLDEPTAHLDLKHRVAILELLSELRRRLELTVLLVTHDVNLASAYASEVVLLRAGQVAGSGPPEAVLTAERLSALFEVSVLTVPHPRLGRPWVIPFGGKD
jgi:iron complex transport system ATP-binding protein